MYKVHRLNIHCMTDYHKMPFSGVKVSFRITGHGKVQKNKAWTIEQVCHIAKSTFPRDSTFMKGA